MVNKKIVFVILHYLVTKETVQAIAHIENNCDTEDYVIICIDNASPNNSYGELKFLYDKNPKIVLIRNEENLGFARGNNVGLRYAEQKYHPDYIVMLNNDVNLIEKQLVKKLDEEFYKSKFAVAGPHIILGNGDETSNPYKLFIPTKKWIKYMITKRTEEIFWAKFGLYDKVCPFLRGKLYKILHIFQPPKVPYVVLKEKDKKPFEQKIYDIGLQGACYFFSREFLERFSGLNEETFFGGEELILYIELMAAKKHTVYMPEIDVIHIGQVSSIASDPTDERIKHRRSFTKTRKVYRLAKKIMKQYSDNHNGREIYMDMPNLSSFENREYSK